MIGLRPSTSKVGLSFLPHLSPLLSSLPQPVQIFTWGTNPDQLRHLNLIKEVMKYWQPLGQKIQRLLHLILWPPKFRAEDDSKERQREDVMDVLGIFIFSYLDHRPFVPFCTFFVEHWKQRTSLDLVKQDVWKVVWSDVRSCEMGCKEQVCGARALFVDFMDLIESCGVLNQSQTSATIRSESLIPC